MEDNDEMSPQREAYRGHMRAMTTARQAAERMLARRGHSPAARREATLVFEKEIARITDEHRAWLHAHGNDSDPQPPRRRQPK
jgi:hypothetical protein